MPVEEVKMYKCPESGKLFKTKALATKNANKIKKQIEEAKEKEELRKRIQEEKDELASYIRLNLFNISDLPNMLIEKAKEFYDIDITNLNIELYFSEACSNSHSCPINGVTNWGSRDKKIPTHYPGWYGRIEARVVVPEYITKNLSGCRNSASDILFDKYSGLFKGFYTSSGCPGANNGNYNMNIGFGFFLEDFPLLVEKYNLYIAEKEKVDQNNALTEEFKNKAISYASNHIDYTTKKELMEKISQEANQIYNTLYKGFCIMNEPQYEPIADNYDEMRLNFKGYL